MNELSSTIILETLGISKLPYTHLVLHQYYISIYLCTYTEHLLNAFDTNK